MQLFPLDSDLAQLTAPIRPAHESATVALAAPAAPSEISSWPRIGGGATANAGLHCAVPGCDGERRADGGQPQPVEHRQGPVEQAAATWPTGARAGWAMRWSGREDIVPMPAAWLSRSQIEREARAQRSAAIAVALRSVARALGEVLRRAASD